MSGRVGDLSTEQEVKLREFRIAIQDIMRPEYDDYYLLRWLRARKFDVSSAESMLRKCLQWRESVGADTILDSDFPDIMLKYLPGGIIGHDKEGCPVWLTPLKDLNLNGWLATEKLRNLLIKYYILCNERNEQYLEMQSRKLGKRVELFIDIFDLDGMPISQIPWNATLKVMEEVFKIYQYYPDRLKAEYIINLPRFCKYLIPFIRLFQSTEMQEKVKFFIKVFYSANPRKLHIVGLTQDEQGSDWKSELLNYIDPSELPKYWGGTKVDPDGDPKCPSIVRFGAKLPTFYYKMSIGEYLSAHPDAKTAIISRSSILPLELIVEDGSLLEWHFMTEHHDIGFGLFLKRKDFKVNGDVSENSCSNDEEIPLIPIQRVESHLVQENGSHQCDIKGIYIFKFDNSYSWFYKKKLFYKISVMPLSSKI